MVVRYDRTCCSGLPSHAPRIVYVSVLPVASVSGGDHRADGNDVRVRVLEVRPARPAQVAFQFRAAASEDGLHFLGGLELEVFPQIAVLARDGDFLDVLGNLLVDEIVEFELALFQARPRNGQVGGLSPRRRRSAACAGRDAA